MESHIRKLAYTGLLTAISVILGRFFAGHIYILGVYALRLSFGDVPIMLSGILLGPIYGMACGVLSDLIGYAINPMGGPYFPGFTLTAAFTGLMPSLFVRLCRNDWSWRVIIMIVTATSVVSVLLNTLWLSILHDKAFFALLPTRIIGRVILIPAYVVIIKMIVKHKQRVFHFTD